LWKVQRIYATSAVQALVQHKGININEAIECDGKYKGFMPLHLAIFKGYRFAVIELLRHKNIDVSAAIQTDEEYNEFTPLKLAISMNYPKIVQELLKQD